MKKKSIIIIISALLVVLILLSACGKVFGGGGSSDASQGGTQSAETSNEGRIRELEAQIIALMQSQQLSETERKKEIAALNEEINRLKNSASTEETKKPQGNEAAPVDSFKYTLDGGRAIISEINAVGDTVTIPSSIDGYQVYSIGSEALRSSSVKSVIISDGIEKLDWFAFRGCSALSSISIPNSVSSIGYGAFDNTAKSLTILCTRDSFAHKYAQSYGFTYDIT